MDFFARLGGSTGTNAERDASRRLSGLYGVSLRPYYIEVPVSLENGDIVHKRLATLTMFDALRELAKHDQQFQTSLLGAHGISGPSYFWSNLKRSNPGVFAGLGPLQGFDHPYRLAL